MALGRAEEEGRKRSSNTTFTGVSGEAEKKKHRWLVNGPNKKSQRPAERVNNHPQPCFTTEYQP